ncbi:MAG: NADH-ubiquinone oxidoreductase-F iron-sulfur binding region domain-containing protein [Promethearchaeota archaeon]
MDPLESLRERREKAKETWKELREREGLVVYYGAASCGRASGVLSSVEVLRSACTRAGLEVDFVETGCIGPCYLEPLIAVQVDGKAPAFYSTVTAERAAEFADRVLDKREFGLANLLGTWGVAGGESARLEDHQFLSAQQHDVLRNCGVIDPNELDHYLAADGYVGLERALGMTPDDVISTVEAAGLRGRGGAGFPTAVKWRFCRDAPGDEKFAICNADEGDPGAFMNRSLIEGDPHAVLEGLEIMAYAVGASQGYIYVRAEYPLAIARLERAIVQMEECGLLGERVLGSDFNFRVKIVKGAGAFVCGEETALIASIMGQRGMPRPKPPFPATSGLWGEPTVINNVETLGNLPNILRNGPDWFRRSGTEKSPGTKTFSLVGKVKNRGLVEVPLGTTIATVVNEIGGGIEGGRTFKAIQTGGPSGGMIPASLSDLPLDYEALAEAGSIMGSGGLIVLDEDTCVVDLAHYFLSFTQNESCGKCVPCRVGTKRMLEILGKIKQGRASTRDLENLKSLAGTVKNTSLCGLGQTAPNPVLTSLRYFEDEYIAHVEERRCPAKVCRDLILFQVDPSRCVGCGICARNCPVGAVSGEKKRAYVIDQEACVQCGRCYENCPETAIEKVDRYAGGEGE